MRTVFIIFMVAIISYFFFSFFVGVNGSDFDTETVIYSRYSDYIRIDGIALKNETVISSDDSVMNDLIYTVENGDRVPVGSIVATYNTSGVGNDNLSDIVNINVKIKQLEASTDKAIMFDADGLDSQIKTAMISVLSDRDSRSFSSLSKDFDALQILFDKKDIAVNGEDYYTGMLNTYADKKGKLLSSKNANEKSVKSKTSGYFCVSCDGYEGISPDGYLDITVAAYESLMSKSPEKIPVNAVGKVQNISSWYFITSVDTSDAADLTVGGTANIEIDFPSSGKNVLSFYVQDISNSVNGKSAVVFRCDTSTSDTVALRKTDAKLMKKSYDGFKISNKALRIVDGQHGVYVLSAQRIVFKPVEILYSSNDFLIVKSPATTSKPLASKDEVIIGGKDLYNGKIVNK